MTTPEDKQEGEADMERARATPIWVLDQLVGYALHGGCQAGLPDGRYVPARPLGWPSWQQRWRAAWLVFTGRADAVMWEGQ